MPVNLTEPWSKKHKSVTKAASGGLPYSLSNSFAQPLSQPELIRFTEERGDQALIDDWNQHGLEYTPNGGSDDLKEEIAKLYGDEITSANILIFAGAQVALQTAAFALARDCHTIVFTPGYQSTVEAAGHSGGSVTRIKLKPENGWQIDPDEVVKAIREDTRYMVINNPHNPTGTSCSLSLLTELVEIAKRHNIRFMSDEVYRNLEHNESERLPAMCDMYEQGLSCVTMSKPWGACGVSIGWLAFRDLQIRQSLVDVQYFGTACPSRASEIQALMVLRANDSIMSKNLRVLNSNFQLLKSFVEKNSDTFEWVPPTAGAIAFIKHKYLSSEEFGSRLVEVGIGMKPAYCFTDTMTPDLANYFRVGYGESKFPVALAALEKYVSENRK